MANHRVRIFKSRRPTFWPWDWVCDCGRLPWAQLHDWETARDSALRHLRQMVWIEEKRGQ